MTKTKTSKLDLSEFLNTPERRAALMADAMQSGDSKYISITLGHIAKAYGMSQLAEKTGLHRQTLYKALGANGNPTLETLLAITSALDINLSASVAA